MKLYAGTSGYSYKEWKGSFYPEDLPADGMLRHYATKLPAVEINNTFYRMPKASVLAQWAEQVPDGFRFVLKASQQITHRLRLKEAAQPVAYFFDIATSVGSASVFDRPFDSRRLRIAENGKLERPEKNSEKPPPVAGG